MIHIKFVGTRMAGYISEFIIYLMEVDHSMILILQDVDLISNTNSILKPKFFECV